MSKFENKKLYEIDKIIKTLEHHFNKEDIILVSTDKYDLTTNPHGRNSKKERSKWADLTVKKLFNEDRAQIIKTSRKHSSGEYNFSYIKFAENNFGKIFGVVHGKSSFNCMYPSDVWFYELDGTSKILLTNLFKKYDLKWYTKAILIIKNIDKNDSAEAYKNEKLLKSLFNTFD